MKAIRIGINGFGRIGRNTLRAAIREGIFDKIDFSESIIKPSAHSVCTLYVRFGFFITKKRVHKDSFLIIEMYYHLILTNI